MSSNLNIVFVVFFPHIYQQRPWKHIYNNHYSAQTHHESTGFSKIYQVEKCSYTNESIAL